MLGLSRALIEQPLVLLVDELSSGLAQELRDPLLAAVQSIAERGTAVLLVEQSVDLALSVCDRAVFLERGTVAFDGPPAVLRRREDLVRSVFLPPTQP